MATFGDISYSLAIGAGKIVRRNVGNTAFEAVVPGTKRVVVITQSATPTINTDTGDIFQITALAQAITSMTTNLSGTPNEGDLMMIQITDNGTGRAITWGASFIAGTSIALPTTTVASVMLRVLFQRVGSTWRATAID